MIIWMGVGTAVTGDPEVNAPSLWSGGVEWGTAETEGTNAYWQASEAPTARTGKPKVCVAIAGRRCPAGSASWTIGRSDWLSTISPNAASFSFVGVVDAEPNDTVVVSLLSDVTTEHSDPLWVGRVDTVSRRQDIAGNYWTSVTAIDVIGILGQAKAPTVIPAGTLDELTVSLAAAAGVSLTVETVAALPELLADVSVDSTVLEYINRMERSSNTLLFLLGNGHLAARQRTALVGTVDVIPLTGLDGYSSWAEDLSVASVINDWSFSNESGSYLTTLTHDASVDAYGTHTYSVSDMLRDDAAYEDIGLDTNLTLASPRWMVTAGEFPITDLGQKVLFLDPLDWVDHDGDIWQVMSVQHDVTLNDWQVTITADQTQNHLVGEANPTPTTEPFLDTQEIAAAKDSTVVRFGGGTFAGGGGDEWLPVGLNDGDVYRALIQFPISWPAGFLRVHKATLHLRTSQQTRVDFGSSPKVEVRRITNSWSEGGATWPAEDDNGVVWPGPGTSKAGQKVATVTRSENSDFDVAITEIAQGWHDDPDGNHGLRIAAVSEEAGRYKTEFFSSDHSTHGPSLTLVCQVSA